MSYLVHKDIFISYSDLGISPWRVSNPCHDGICHSSRRLNHSATEAGTYELHLKELLFMWYCWGALYMDLLINSQCWSVYWVDVLLITFRTKDETFLNKQVGHLLRTKTVGTDEGGVATGFSAIDSPYLVWAYYWNQYLTTSIFIFALIDDSVQYMLMKSINVFISNILISNFC